MLKLSIFSKLHLGSYISSVVKLPPLETDSICEISFFPEVALYVYKFTMQPCMEYYCHVWADAPNHNLEMLDMLQKWVCKTVGLSLTILNL